MLGSAMRRLRVKNSARSHDNAAVTAHIEAVPKLVRTNQAIEPRNSAMPNSDENIAEAADEAQLLVVLPIFVDGVGELRGFERAQAGRLLDRENALSDGAVEGLLGYRQGMLSTTTLRLV